MGVFDPTEGKPLGPQTKGHMGCKVGLIHSSILRNSLHGTSSIIPGGEFCLYLLAPAIHKAGEICSSIVWEQAMQD
jgi:hypothetical protein